ncbi:molybdopterin-guanine dinucleotide biosynthesis protein B [Gracilibacillus ureilyticus]|uniref:Molybdopterin-guanine dinucleotide biosynthesis protein B n=1 Tax=Gracilibacillus ureilyticus TaxID=531814 RepID=A0A1H9S2M3_9BACI|nr:molybdopterin-guanine dinucleotide biosynthesis protein B [Gracilibacillus ureilyticus]SER78389.1 molybdopterin-guanine dinucleotide biosynthesis protein B [Gracilibacillus ureilyticus]
MFVIQIVGYKNSGKTSLAVELIKCLQQKNCKVATIKHHGHGGEPDIVTNTDTDKHWIAGAAHTAVIGEKTTEIRMKNESVSVEKILKLYNDGGISITVIEGFKYKDYPKIVLIRNREDCRLLDELTNIKMVYSQDPSISHASKPLYHNKEILIQAIQQQLSEFRSVT